MNFLKIKSFSKVAPKLRQHFDASFANPRSAVSTRFKWDPWYVKDQYYQLRTPAWEYFQSEDYKKIHTELVNWGRKNLGCWDISPPWLSLYLDGHFQKPHADKPHGPWAFVLSLCDGRLFTGGETFIFKNPPTTGHAQNFYETEHYFDLIKPQFNQLLVFPPSQMHGVEQVRGPMDPRDGRLVLHGWFTKPRVQIEGPLTQNSQAAQNVLDLIARETIQKVLTTGPISGYFCLELTVVPTGKVSGHKVLVGTEKRHIKTLDNALKSTLKSFGNNPFPKKNGKSVIRIPLEFE